MVTLMPYVKSGKLRALAVSSKERSITVPDVPTLHETVLPGFETGTWYGMVAPASTPPAITMKISAELRRILNSPEVREKLVSMGLNASGMSDGEYGDFIKSEITKYAKIVKAADVKLQ